MEEYGKESVSILSTFIENAGKNSRKEEIVKEWEKLIISFYKRSNSKKIFEGQVIMAYQSQVGGIRNFSRIDVVNWVQKMFLYKEEAKNKNLLEIMRKKSFSSSDMKKITGIIDENNKKINEKKEKIALFAQKKVDNIEMLDYWEYYICALPLKVEQKLASGEVESLLPQDIIQQIIQDDFDSIPI